MMQTGASEADRLFPLHMTFDKEPLPIFLATASGAAACFIPVNYIPIYFIFTRDDSGIEAAIRPLPYIFILGFTILINGAFIGELGYYKLWYLFGTPLLLVGDVLMSRIDVNTSTKAIYSYEVLIGLGAGAFAQSGFAIIQALIAPEQMANAITLTVSEHWSAEFLPVSRKCTDSSVLQSGQIIGQLSGITFGLAIAGAVFVNGVLNSLKVILANAPLDQLAQLIAGTSSALLDGIDVSTLDDMLGAIVLALRKVFIPVDFGAAVALICGVFLKNQKMHGTAAPL